MIFAGLGSSTCRALPFTTHWAPSSHKLRLALLAAAAVFSGPSHGTGISKMLQCHCNWTALSSVASADFLQGLWPYHMVPSLDFFFSCVVTKVLSLSCSLRVLMTSNSWITWETFTHDQVQCRVQPCLSLARGFCVLTPGYTSQA